MQSQGKPEGHASAKDGKYADDDCDLVPEAGTEVMQEGAGCPESERGDEDQDEQRAEVELPGTVRERFRRRSNGVVKSVES